MKEADRKKLAFICTPESTFQPQLFLYYDRHATVPTEASLTALHQAATDWQRVGFDSLTIRTWPLRLDPSSNVNRRLDKLASLLDADGLSRTDMIFQRMEHDARWFDDPQERIDVTPEAAISILPNAFGRTREIRRRESCTEAFLTDCVQAGLRSDATCRMASDWLTGRTKMTAVP